MPDWTRHTAYSDPGRHRPLLRDLSASVGDASAVARNVIRHYRAEPGPEHRRDEVDSRWLERILDVDQARHPVKLTEPREPTSRVAGCCRDHALLVVGTLREHGIPARSCVGFAGYLLPRHHLDHVVVEHWDGARWRRLDPGQRPGSQAFDVTDLPTGTSAPFQTAAEVWRAYRRGDVDPARYCVQPGSELSGPSLIRGYVVSQTAHRYGDELLLWDGWGATVDSADEELIDAVAALLVQADAGDVRAEDELAAWYARDDRLHPGDTVTQYSPYGEEPRLVDLRAHRVVG